MEAVKSITYKAIDLGLSVLWADRNAGGLNPDGEGNYYSWGELSQWRCEASYYSHFPDPLKNICNHPDFDTALYACGKPWRMPSLSEFEELLEKCEWIWRKAGDFSGYCGYDVIGANGNKIFLPAAGLFI